MKLTNASKAGVALFLGVVQFGLFVIIAESVSPSYSVSVNYISDLGKLFPSSAPIFNSSITLLGLLVLVNAYFIQRAFKWRPGTAMIALAGVGQVGVGSFPEGSPYMLHSIFSLVTFLFIGLAAILMARWQRAPMSFFSIALGAITLVSMLLYIPDSGTYWGGVFGIGPGGLERMIVYPVLFWGVAFSGYLMGHEPGASS